MIRPSHDGVAADANQGANLSFAFKQNLFCERGGWESGCAISEVSHPELLSEAPAFARRHRLRVRFGGGHQDAGVWEGFAFASPIAAQCVEAQDQVLSEVPARRHIGARARCGGGLCAARKHSCGRNKVVLVDAGSLCCIPGCEI